MNWVFPKDKEINHEMSKTDQVGFFSYVKRLVTCVKALLQCRPIDYFFVMEGFWARLRGPNFPSPRVTMLALRLDCSTAALTTKNFLSILRLVELRMLDFSDRTRIINDVWLIIQGTFILYVCNIRPMNYPTEQFPVLKPPNPSIASLILCSSEALMNIF